MPHSTEHGTVQHSKCATKHDLGLSQTQHSKTTHWYRTEQSTQHITARVQGYIHKPKECNHKIPTNRKVSWPSSLSGFRALSASPSGLIVKLSIFDPPTPEQFYDDEDFWEVSKWLFYVMSKYVVTWKRQLVHIAANTDVVMLQIELGFSTLSDREYF